MLSLHSGRGEKPGDVASAHSQDQEPKFDVLAMCCSRCPSASCQAEGMKPDVAFTVSWGGIHMLLCVVRHLS